MVVVALPRKRSATFAQALLWICLWLASAGALAQALVEVPVLKARVTDAGAIMPAAARDALEAKLAAFEQAHGSQIAVLLLPSTQPEPIEDYAHRVGEAWKIGRKGVGDGLLIIIAANDKRVRIDVARALEGAVPDLAAKKIIRENMSPRFAQGDFAGGLDAGVDALIRLIEGEALPPPQARKGSAVVSDNNALEAWLMIGFIALIVGGSILKSLLGRAAGSLVGAGGIGVIAWLVAGSLWVALAIAVVALLFLLIMGGGRGGRGGGLGVPFGIGGGGSSGGSSWGGFSSGSGGDFSGGGASGGWGDSGGGGGND